MTALARPLLAIAALSGCADAATAARPPTNHPSDPVDAATDATTGGSLIAVGGGDLDASPTPDRLPPVDVRVVPSDVARDVIVDVPRDVSADVARDAVSDVPRDVGADVRVDASVDVTRDVTDDARPAEICGNGVDDNGDGRIDEDCPSTQCPVPQEPRTHVWFEGRPAPPSLLPVLAARGLTVETGAVSGAALPSASVLVLTIYGAHPDAWNERVRAWVNAGGALMTLIVGVGDSAPEECDGPNALIAPFGVSYSCEPPAPWGPVTAFFPHPITDGLTPEDVPFENGRAVAARPGVVNAPIAQIDGRVVARATTPGCGRVLVWGDEHVSFEMYWPHTQRFWEQSIAWLTAAR